MVDPRFSALSSDPRYRFLSRKEARTTVDPRFKTLFTNQDFQQKASVDRYGRRIKPTPVQKDFERLYRLDKTNKPTAKNLSRDVLNSSEASEDDEDGAEEGLATKRDHARGGGFPETESSEEETSSEDEESDTEVGLADDTAGQEQDEEIPMGEVSKRVACVNLDWDNIRAADIMAVAQSFADKGGRVENVTVYPSEFGKERLEREEIEGPPREIFASSKKQDDVEESEESDDGHFDEEERIKERLLKSQASEGEEFDTAKLRQYQLERLRYYYAVISCDKSATAKAIYDSMDGREYLSTSNFFDLRFVPDSTSFEDDKPHDECSQLPPSYKPNEFRTEALTHSKVRLTWDEDDATRKEVQKRAFSRAEIDENDLQAYIGSEYSDLESVSSRKSSAEDRKAKKKAKIREALGLSIESTKAKSGIDEVVGDMQITFTSGLNGDKGGKGVFENEPQDEESTRDRYVRRERERKQKRKEKMKSSRQGGTVQEDSDVEEREMTTAAANDEEDPFDDPFFNDPAIAAKQEKAAKKATKQAKIDARNAADAEAQSRKAELELLMAEDDSRALKHFDMREIEKAKKAAKKSRNKGKKGRSEAVEDDFKVETEDPRFMQLFDSHEFAIDPSHPRFKGSDAMKAVLEEGRKKRKHAVTEDDPIDKVNGKGSKKARDIAGGGAEDVRGLVARLKKRR